MACYALLSLIESFFISSFIYGVNPPPPSPHIQGSFGNTNTPFLLFKPIFSLRLDLL